MAVQPADDAAEFAPASTAQPSRPAIETIVRTAFCSDALPEGERAAAYGELVGGTGRMTALAEPFHAAFDAYAVGPLRFHDVRAVPHLFERDAAKIALDGVRQLLVQHVVRGRGEIEVEGRTVLAPEGSVFAVSFARPLAIREVGEAVHLRMLTMSRRVAETALGDIGALHGRVLGAERAAPYTDHFAAVWPTLATLTRAGVPAVVAATLDVLAEAFGRRAAPWAAERSGPALRRMQAYIEQRLSDRTLSPEGVGAALNVARTQLYAAFEDEGGVSRYIRRRRLARVHAALEDPSDTRTMSTLAFDFGFSSQAQLARQFRRAFGKTASDVRRNGANFARSEGRDGGAND